MADPVLIVEKEGAILIVTLNRPREEKRHQLRGHVPSLRCLDPIERR